jgi:hypothetical protein
MRTSQRPTDRVAHIVLGLLTLTPLLTLILGAQCVIPVHAAHGHNLNLERHAASTQERATSSSRLTPPAVERLAAASIHQALPGDSGLRTLLPALDPHDNLHLFLVLPALAGLLILGGSAVKWAVLTRWRSFAGTDAQASWWRRYDGARLRYGLLALSWWLALSAFLIMDLAGSVSLYLGFTLAYAVCSILAGVLILHSRPMREKLLAVILFAAVLLSIRSIHWNSRKPFLKDLARVRVGTPVAQVEGLMEDYMPGTGTFTEVDAQGRVVAGTITYRHTAEGWGNSDAAVLTISGGRVVEVDFLPD